MTTENLSKIIHGLSGMVILIDDGNSLHPIKSSVVTDRLMIGQSNKEVDVVILTIKEPNDS